MELHHKLKKTLEEVKRLKVDELKWKKTSEQEREKLQFENDELKQKLQYMTKSEMKTLELQRHKK